MEKQQQNCDSMTTVTVKDFNTQMDYQEPPPAYRPMKTSPMVQVAKIVAIAAVAIAGMLSFAIVFSAWLTNSSCQQQLQQLQHQQQQHQHQQFAAQPSFEALIQPESLKSLLALGTTGPASSLTKEDKDNEKANDLDSAESKASDNASKNDSSSSEEEEDNNNSGEEAVTMLKLPVELSFQEHMFERGHRSHMNCIIEKKKAEEIVDEQSKPLPPLLGINMSTDPRYLHFTGEKMAISCDSGNDHHHAPHGGMPMMEQGPPPPPRHHHHHHPMPMPFGSGNSGVSGPAQTLASAIAAASSSSVPIQIIGPIPLSSNSEQSFPQFFQSASGGSSGPFGNLGLGAQMIPILVSQGNSVDDSPNQGNTAESIFLGPVVAPPANQPHHQIHYQPQQQHSSQQHSSLDAQFPFLPHPPAPSHPFQFSPAGPQQHSAEIRERAVPHPIPIMPRAHVQHVIRPRSVDNVVKRMKRCACDCACRNHQE
ncbi:hypothetical protein Ocin01_02481 [Orchesella cincta]|uniref:Uncharacterized protein n=1 Tax=Orchesella cincta TaxID=48709 RepID=A0A1D2NG25_ORCCI|nr:hypothetical protein Ocin01_02481 [Orchesella cincta]